MKRLAQHRLAVLVWWPTGGRMQVSLLKMAYDYYRIRLPAAGASAKSLLARIGRGCWPS